MATVFLAALLEGALEIAVYAGAVALVTLAIAGVRRWADR